MQAILLRDNSKLDHTENFKMVSAA